jgi:hypothetical protein
MQLVPLHPGVGIITVGSSLSTAEDEEDEYGPRPGVLYVIDLAGSERSSDSANHSKERMDETKAVNLSLMSLKVGLHKLNAVYP